VGKPTNASLIAEAAVVLGFLMAEQGNVAWHVSSSPAAAEAARRATEAGGLLTILSVPWVAIAVQLID
jgi:hypothetical protein